MQMFDRKDTLVISPLILRDVHGIYLSELHLSTRTFKDFAR